jgi:hypothetical protein
MPTINCGKLGIISFTGNYKPGDQPPSGYCDWHAWADVQHKAGLRQKRCGNCSKWNFPQELTDVAKRHYVKTANGKKVLVTTFLCKECAKE